MAILRDAACVTLRKYREVPVTEPVWIITVVKNDARGLARTLASIQGQEAVPIRHLVVDGGSTDGCHEMGLDLARRGLVDFLPGPDNGVFDGMNRGLRAVPAGSLVWFLNSGDFFLGPHVVASALRQLHESGNPKAWIGGKMLLVCPTGQVVKAVGATDPASSRWSFARRPSGTPPQPSVLVPKALLDDLGGFRSDLSVGADGVLFDDLAQIYPPILDEATYVGFPLGGLSTDSAMEGFQDFWRNASGELGSPPSCLRKLSLRLRIRLRQGYCADKTSVSRFVARLLRWLSQRGAMRPTEPCQWPNHSRCRGSLECCIQMGA